MRGQPKCVELVQYRAQEPFWMHGLLNDWIGFMNEDPNVSAYAT